MRRSSPKDSIKLLDEKKPTNRPKDGQKASQPAYATQRTRWISKVDPPGSGG